MLQPMLLLLEIILLAATAYIYWMTRQLARNGKMRIADPLAAAEGAADQLNATQMIRDVSELLAELQSVAGAAHDDLARQSSGLQKLLVETETAGKELRALLNQAEAARTISPVGHKPEPIEAQTAAPQPVMNTAPPLSLADALTGYGKHLPADGRTKSTVSRTIGHIRGFVIWLGGQRYDEVPLSRIGAAEIESYLNYLKKDYQDKTIKRKLSAIHAFVNWTDTQLLGSTGEIKEIIHPEEKSVSKAVQETPGRSATSPSKADVLVGANRYQAVFALAEQGLEQPDIAARTGLEQESVRMLLAMGAPSDTRH